MKFTIDIIKHEKSWKQFKFINKALVKKLLTVILNEFSCFINTTHVEIALLLTDNAEMARLNKTFRQKEKPTNVISFPDQELNWRELNNILLPKEIYLGDIAFAYEITKMEAEESNDSFENHFTHLLVHAILHLIGFDHIDEQESKVMEQHEVKILHQFNIPSPY